LLQNWAISFSFGVAAEGSGLGDVATPALLAGRTAAGGLSGAGTGAAPVIKGPVSSAARATGFAATSPGSAVTGKPGLCAPTTRLCAKGRTSSGFDGFISSSASTGEALANRYAATSSGTCDL
jgi:hypothetical protein